MPKFAANLTMLFNEHDFLDRFAAAAKAGFKAVELLRWLRAVTITGAWRNSLRARPLEAVCAF